MDNGFVYEETDESAMDNAVETIKKMSLHDDASFHKAMAIIRSLWRYRDTAFKVYASRYTLHTFGCSENERLVEAFLDNPIGKFYVLSYRRGGHYVFAPIGYMARSLRKTKKKECYGTKNS
jgi:hypothetical protein